MLIDDKPYLTTHSGRKLHFLDPSEDELSIDDIALGMSREGRYSNQAPYVYRVGQHCILVSQLREKMAMGNDPKSLLQALLHDASESFLRDIPSPLKRYLPDYKNIEHIVQSAIYRKWKLPEDLSDSIKLCDSALLVAESRDMQFEIDLTPSDMVKDLAVWVPKIIPYDEETTYREYMTRFNYLVDKILW